MRKQRRIERKVRKRLPIILSRKRLNTGEVKQRTMRSPIGIRGIAAIHAKLIVAIENP